MFLRVFNVLLGVFVAYLAYAKNVEVRIDEPVPLSTYRNLALWFQPRSSTLTFWSAGVLGLVNILGAFLDRQRVTNAIVERILDGMVKNHFNDKPQVNRLTLFRTMSGWRLMPIAFIRLFIHEDRGGKRWRSIFQTLLRNPGHTYVFPYIRAKHARHRHSCIPLRVSEEDYELCEGVAGHVWAHGWLVLSPSVTGTLNAGGTKRGFGWYKDDAKARLYAEATFIKDPKILDGMSHPANHFVGVAIQRHEGHGVWGVLLLDSIEQKCPFPKEGTKGYRSFRSHFEEDAKTLSRILS